MSSADLPKLCRQVTADAPVVFRSFRLRYVAAESVPLLNRFRTGCGSVVLIDLVAPSKQGEDEDTFVSCDSAQSPPAGTQSALGGSPLRVHFLDISKLRVGARIGSGRISTCADFDLNPVPTIRARTLLSAYNVQVTSALIAGDEPKTREVWVACDATDPQRTVFHASRLDESVLALSNVRYVGFAPASKLSPKLTSLAPTLSATTAKTTVAAEMCVLDDLSDGGTEQTAAASIRLCATWKPIGAVALLNKPGNNATVRALVRPGFGDERAPLSAAAAELRLLTSLSAAFGTGEVAWHGEGSVDWAGESLTVEAATARLIDKQSALSGSQSVDLKWSSKEGIRSDLDFSDHLWMIVKECNAYAQVARCFQQVLAALKSGVLKLVFAQENVNAFARLARDAQQANVVLPRLDGFLPVQLLAEMGIAKLRQDYLAAFSAGGEQLAELSTADVVAGAALDEQVTALRRLHVCVETMLLARSYLRLPAHRLSSIVRRCLSTTDLSGTTFDFELRPAEVQSLLEMWSSEEWARTTVRSCEGDPVERVVDLLSRAAPVGMRASTDEAAPLSDDSYHAFQLIESLTDFS